MGSKLVSVSEVAAINAGQYSKSECWDRIQYLDTGSITRGVISGLQQLDPQLDRVPSRARRKVRDKSILLSMVRPNQEHYGILNNPPKDMLVSTGFSVIDADEKLVDPSYLYYALTTKEATAKLQALAEQSASTYPTLSGADLASFEIPLLAFDLQRKIGGILSCFDRKIGINSRLNGYLLELATARFEHELFDERSILKFSDLVELEDSKRIPLNSRDRETRKGSYPYYGAASIMGYVDDYLFDDIRVLLGEDGTVIQEDGRPVLQYVWGKYWVNNHAHILKSKSNYSLEAIYVALARTAINHIVTGAVQRKISQKNLKNLELEMPAANSLGYLKDIFALYRSNIEESKRLESIRDSLLPRFMSGEIDVSQIDPAQLNSHLLES